MSVIITCNSACVCVDFETLSQALKSGTAKPNSDHGKSVKVVYTNSPI